MISMIEMPPASSARATAAALSADVRLTTGTIPAAEIVSRIRAGDKTLEVRCVPSAASKLCVGSAFPCAASKLTGSPVVLAHRSSVSSSAAWLTLERSPCVACCSAAIRSPRRQPSHSSSAEGQRGEPAAYAALMKPAAQASPPPRACTGACHTGARAVETTPEAWAITLHRRLPPAISTFFGGGAREAVRTLFGGGTRGAVWSSSRSGRLYVAARRGTCSFSRSCACRVSRRSGEMAAPSESSEYFFARVTIASSESMSKKIQSMCASISSHSSSNSPSAGRWFMSHTTRTACCRACRSAAHHAARGPAPSSGVMPVQWNHCSPASAAPHAKLASPTLLQKQDCSRS
mmetsp:Transcript_48653/g.120644  ORF Transcript_48653/g.120644 Transcript_48653/m.120644 type:complete len:348 (+) Transcript_48653:1008-2051(+)